MAKKKAAKKTSKNVTAKKAESKVKGGGDVRLFEFRDSKSDKFWSISVSGSSHTVTYGRVGTDGQSSTKDFSDPDKARSSYAKLIEQKTKKGYKEVTTNSSRSIAVKRSKQAMAAHEPFLDAIDSEPDELAHYQVYADWLSELGDPRGEFIHTQILLEDANVKGANRKQLKATEKRLLKKHVREWMDDNIVPYFVDNLQPADPPEYQSGEYGYSFARGFLDTITFNVLDHDFCDAMAKADLRSVRQVTVTDVFYEDEGEGILKLSKGRFNSCRVLRLGCDDYHANGENFDRLVKKMPRLEDIYTSSTSLDGKKLFRVKLPQLRSLEMEAGYDHPLEVLGKNDSMGALERLSIFPHMLDPGDSEAYVSLKSFQAFCKSKHLTSLKELTILCTEFGDAGIQTLVKAPFFGQLEVLNLSHGTIRLDGFELLANQDLSQFKTIDLSSNFIPADAIKLHKSRFPKLVSTFQFSGEIDPDSKDHLWEGSME